MEEKDRCKALHRNLLGPPRCHIMTKNYAQNNTAPVSSTQLLFYAEYSKPSWTDS